METRNDQFKPRWRHFHPQSTVWVQNPFDEDIVFKVADENNQQYEYIIKANKLAELPGGMIATLGVKEIIDALISQNKQDLLRIWDESVRAKYEEQVIVRIKEAPLNKATTPSGKIDLSVSQEDSEEEVETIEAPAKEEAFADLNSHAKKVAVNIAEQSLGSDDQVIESD